MKKRTLTFILTIICLLFWACSSFAKVTQYQEAINAFKRKDYKTAYQLILPLAKKGSAKAQYSLGMMYEKGKGSIKTLGKQRSGFNLQQTKALLKRKKK